MDFAVILLLLLLGLLLIVVETLLPGGIVGFFGVATIVGSAVLCFSKYGTLWGSIYLIVCISLGIGVGISAFLMVAKRLSLVPPEAAEDENNPSEQIGKMGRVLKNLNPTGYIEMDGQRLLARSGSSEISIAEGQEVVVTAVDSTYMVVEEATESGN